MEVIYADGSRSEFTEGGGSLHEGDLAIARIQLLHAKAALEIYLKSDGRMQWTRDGHRLAVINVIEPMSGQKFSSRTSKVTKKSCREALEACYAMLHAIETGAVIWKESE
jgi:hypothetical protein